MERIGIMNGIFIKTKILFVKLDLRGLRVHPNQKRDLKGEQKIDFFENLFFAPPLKTIFTNFAVRYGKICYNTRLIVFMKILLE